MRLSQSPGGGGRDHNQYESSTNFLRPVREGYVEAASRPLKVGRTVIVVETAIVDAEGRAVARVVQSQAVLD